jgi:hypothetical protein
MKHSYIPKIAFSIAFVAFSFSTASAEGLVYDFDRVDVKFATEFQVMPAIESNGTSWATELAGGTADPLTVTYGIVDLIKNDQPAWSEEFVKVTGKNGSERFLVNSGSPEFYE